MSQFDEAVSTLLALYYAAVRDVAEEIASYVRDREIEDAEQFDRRLKEEINGHEWTSSAPHAKVVGLVSDHTVEAASEAADLGFETDLVTAVAFYAMKADIRRQYGILAREEGLSRWY